MSETARAFNRSPTTSVRYCYIITDTAKGTKIYLTGAEEDIVVNGLSASDGSDPQTFTSTPIAHSGFRKSQEFDEQQLTVFMPKDGGTFAPLFLSSITAAIRIKIIRINSYADNPTDLDADSDITVVEEGLMRTISFTDTTAAAEIVPDAYAQNFSVPRMWFSRTCNHALYGNGCKLNSDDWKWDTTVIGIDRQRREVEVLGQDAATPEHWFLGTISHDPSGVKASIIRAQHLDNGNTLLTTNSWLPFIKETEGCRLLPGCRRIPDDCTLKFANGHNFGGFLKIPTRIPAEHGV